MTVFLLDAATSVFVCLHVYSGNIAPKTSKGRSETKSRTGRVGQFFELHEVKLVLPLSLVSDCAIDALPEVFGYGNKTQRAD